MRYKAIKKPLPSISHQCYTHRQICLQVGNVALLLALSSIELSLILLLCPNRPTESSQIKAEGQHHKLEETLDHQVLVPEYLGMQKKIDAGEPIVMRTAINNRNRAVGTTLSHQITR